MEENAVKNVNKSASGKAKSEMSAWKEIIVSENNAENPQRSAESKDNFFVFIFFDYSRNAGNMEIDKICGKNDK